MSASGPPPAVRPIALSSFPVYRIETARFVLRPWAPSDAPALAAAQDESREHLSDFMPWAVQPESVDEVVRKLRVFRASFDRGEDFLIGAFDHDGAIVGGTGLHPRVGPGGIEIGYWVHAAHVRRGIATEIAAALTRVALEILGMRWVEIRCASTNEPSAGVARKLGFTHEATLRDRLILPTGRIDDVRVFSMLARDYAANAAPVMKALTVRAFDAVGREIGGPGGREAS